MTLPPTSSLEQYFGELPDPREGQNVQHPLLSIVSIAICAVICGADNWVDVAMFGQAKQVWLETFLELPHGIPSHDTFGRVFRRINPAAFEACFGEWTQALCSLTAGEVVALDGKHLRRSKDRVLGHEGIRLVSAWASENALMLAQAPVAEGSNEIPTLLWLLELLDLSGSIVTIDGIGCQTEIAAAIVEQQANYVLAVKGNQETLAYDVQAAFEPTPPDFQPHYAKTVNKGHGRVEIRECWATDAPDVLAFIQDYKAWSGLRSLVKITAERRLASKIEVETRYFIASLPPDPVQLLQVVRAHWQIENAFHWILDVAFREDDSRVRKDHAPRNLALLRRLALNLLKREASLKVGIKAKRLRAGWDAPYLLKVLCSS
jgi:predicted transposase YbfD/YdcC